MPWTLALVNLLAGPLGAAARLYAWWRPERYGDAWPHRFGLVPERGGGRRCVWIHAVSVGEVHATRTLVAELQARLPGHEVVVSSTTRTGLEAARRLYPSLYVFGFPLDLPRAVARTLERVRPAAILLMELEVWPNLIAQAARRGIPVCIVNGRVTEERSMRRFRAPVVRSIARWMFGRLALVAAQDNVYASRFRELGARADRIHTVGTMKYDTAAAASGPVDVDGLAAAVGLVRADPVCVAGSTGPGEEELLLTAFAEVRARHPRLQLVIVPRKPERFEEVAGLIAARGMRCIRRSQRRDGTAAPTAQGAATGEAAAVVLGDTMGELRRFYGLADLVFVGRSLVAMGGSDPMEPAALGKPLLFGPHMENFADAADKLLAADAARRVMDAGSLAQALAKWLDEPAAARRAGAAAAAVVCANTGATRVTVELVRGVLRESGDDGA